MFNGLYDIYYASGVPAQLPSLGWAIRLCESEMGLRKRDGDLYPNVERLGGDTNMGWIRLTGSW